MNDPGPETAVTLRLAPEYRRVLCYVLVGGGLWWIAFEWNVRIGPNQKPLGLFPVLFVVSISLLSAACVLRWAVRIDRTGIARRWLFRWDLWPWSDFAGGRIGKQHPFTLIHLDRAWWRKRMSLGGMSRADIKRAMDAINTHYRFPEPDCVLVRSTLSFRDRREPTLDSAGIRLTGPDGPREYGWDDVRRVRITRMDPLRHDFRHLEIVLPDDEIVLDFSERGLGWGAFISDFSSGVNQQLCRYVSAERIDVDVFGERPAWRRDVDRQSATVRKGQRQTRIMAWILVPACTSLLIWMATKTVLGAFCVATLFAVFPGMVLVLDWKRSRARVRQLEAWAATYEDDDTMGEPPPGQPPARAGIAPRAPEPRG